MSKIDIGIIVSLVSLLGILVKIVADYTKLKEKVVAIEKDCKDIRIDTNKDIQNASQLLNNEINTMKEDAKAEKKYTHESFVKITNEQQQTSVILKEVSITLRSMTNTMDQRLTSLERKIDSITTLKVARNDKY